jgi:hypothetical protein
MKSACLKSARAAAAACAALLLAAVPPAAAGPFLSNVSRNAQDTTSEVGIKGIPGESFQISYIDDATGAAATKTVTLTTLLTQFTTVPARKGTTITITNLSQPAEPAQSAIASRFDPATEVVVTALTVDPGSSLTAFGNTFALAGGFTAFGTDVVYDPAAPDFGTLSGILPQSLFSLAGTGAAGTVVLTLNADHPWSIDLDTAWDADLPDTGLILPYAQAFAGTLAFGGLTMPFVGSIAGTVTFFPGGVETVAGSFDFGFGSGSFSATGTSRLVPIPEPASLLLLASALGLLAALRRRG